MDAELKRLEKKVLDRMEAEEPVRLYRCYACARPRYYERIQQGETMCPKCGDTHVKYAPPTWRYVLPYIWNRKDWNIFRKIKELVTHRVVESRG